MTRQEVFSTLKRYCGSGIGPQLLARLAAVDRKAHLRARHERVVPARIAGTVPRLVEVLAREVERLQEERRVARDLHAAAVRVREGRPAHRRLSAAVLRADVVDVLVRDRRAVESHVAAFAAVHVVLPRAASVPRQVLERRVEPLERADARQRRHVAERRHSVLCRHGAVVIERPDRLVLETARLRTRHAHGGEHLAVCHADRTRMITELRQAFRDEGLAHPVVRVGERAFHL